MKIKGYQEFILEKINTVVFEDKFNLIQKYDSISNLEQRSNIEYMIVARNSFANKIKGLEVYFDSNYSELASDINANPEEDFDTMQKIIDKSGFTLPIIKKLFDKKICELSSEYYPYFIHKNNLDTINGYIDIYLYFLDEKLKISESTGIMANKDLGGGHADTLLNREINKVKSSDDPDLDEWLIKYAYGYHKTLYGKLLLSQIDLKPEEFERITLEKLMANIYIKYMDDFHIEDTYDLIEEEIEEEGGLISKENNTYIFYLDSFFEIINKQVKNDYESFKEEFILWLTELSRDVLQVEDKGMILKATLDTYI